MADEDGKVASLNERTLQRVQERLSSLEQGPSQILKLTNELQKSPRFGLLEVCVLGTQGKTPVPSQASTSSSS
jgi:hypothetical protein